MAISVNHCIMMGVYTMSKYTMTIKSICDMMDSVGKLKSFDEHIEKSRSKIFDFDYPIFDENYRSVLETKILKHYYMDEICEETYGLWHIRLNTKINEILPYYNQLYESTLLKYNPLWNSDFTTEHEGTSDETNNNVSGFDSNTIVNNDENTDTTNNMTSNTTDEKQTSSHSENESNDEYSNSYVKNVKSESANNSTESAESKTQNSGSGTSQDTSKTTFGKTNTTITDISDTSIETPSTKTVVRESDTPQGSISRIENNTYLSKATIQDNSGNNTTTQNGTTTNTSNDGGTEDRISNNSHNENTSSSVNSDTVSESKTVNNTNDTGSDSGTKHNTNVSNILTKENGNSDTNVSESGNIKTTSNSETNISNTSNSNTKINNINSYTTHVFGNNGKSYPSLIKEFRESFLNIDMMIIDELEELFFGLWN